MRQFSYILSTNDSKKNHVPHGLAWSAYGIRADRVDHYARYNFFSFVDQSSSRGLEKFGEKIPTIPEVIAAHTLNFKPNFKFSRPKVLGVPHPHLGVRYQGLVNL